MVIILCARRELVYNRVHGVRWDTIVAVRANSRSMHTVALKDNDSKHLYFYIQIL